MFYNLLDTNRRWFAHLRKPAAWAMLAVLMVSQAMAGEGELPMKVVFRQTGGYAGPAGDRTCELDTRSMQAADAKVLRSLVERSEIAKLKTKEQPAPPKGAADFFTYSIRVKTDQDVKEISFDDMNVPQSVVPLLEYLSDRCQ